MVRNGSFIWLIVAYAHNSVLMFSSIPISFPFHFIFVFFLSFFWFKNGIRFSLPVFVFITFYNVSFVQFWYNLFFFLDSFNSKWKWISFWDSRRSFFFLLYLQKSKRDHLGWFKSNVIITHHLDYYYYSIAMTSFLCHFSQFISYFLCLKNMKGDFERLTRENCPWANKIDQDERFELVCLLKSGLTKFNY